MKAVLKTIICLVMFATTCAAQDSELGSCSATAKSPRVKKIRVSEVIIGGLVAKKPDMEIPDSSAKDFSDVKQLRVEFTVDTEGFVSCFDIVQVNGSAPTGDIAALRLPVSTGFKAWRFQPYLLNGEPLNAVSRVRLDHKKNSLKPNFTKD